MKNMKTLIKSLSVFIALFAFTAGVQAQKFGYINSQELIQNLPEVKEANAEIETLKTQLQKKGEPN